MDKSLVGRIENLRSYVEAVSGQVAITEILADVRELESAARGVVEMFNEARDAPCGGIIIQPESVDVYFEYFERLTTILTKTGAIKGDV